jgi:arylsulfatase A-like enzyme
VTRVAARAATGGALAFSLVEWILTLLSNRGHLPWSSHVRVVLLAIALGTVWWVVLFAAICAASVIARAVQLLRGVIGRLPNGAWTAASAIATSALVWVVQHAATAKFKEPILTAAVVASMASVACMSFAGLRKSGLLQPSTCSTPPTPVPRAWGLIFLGAFTFVAVWRAGVISVGPLSAARAAMVIATVSGCCAALSNLTVDYATSLLRVMADVVGSSLGVFNPLLRRRAALVAVAIITATILTVAWLSLPQVRSVLAGRDRLLISLFVTALGSAQALATHRRRSERPLARFKFGRTIAALATSCTLLTAGTLLWWGGEPQSKYAVLTGSPMYDRLIALVRFANDFDRDDYGSLLGERDCAPFNSSIHPGAIDIPDNGVDENCDGREFSLRDLEPPATGGMPVPSNYARKDWNFLLITVDTVRYDRTSFGGYRDGPAHRDTTPNLAEFVDRSTSFTFAQAPSAGTMASIPAIITSKFFHSGIALDVTGVTPGLPPRLRPENTTLAEIMKRADYATGVIASHEYWNDWGMDQGVDSYDNSIGAKPDAFRVVADKVTNHALTFISEHQNQKWFLWAHYIDPHGRYVAHPDVIDWAGSEPDLYDAELRWTDQELGRLFRELERMPGADRTIIVLTSDHGDSMGEHNIPVGTHGVALYRELLRVPLIFYVPNNMRNLIGGAVTNLDIVPTIAELAGIDVSDLSFEGRSLVPQIFYGKADPERIVFAETNAPSPTRAAISESFKYIYYLQNNVAEFYDLKADPNELTNLAGSAPASMTPYKAALDAWLERVVFSRDPTFNQLASKMADVLLKSKPSPPVLCQATIASDAISVMGMAIADQGHLAPGGKVDILVYFAVNKATTESLRFGFVLSPHPGGVAIRVPARATINGLFPSERWHAGEFIRERFTVTLPETWTVTQASAGLLVTRSDGSDSQLSGPMLAGEKSTLDLGALPIQLNKVNDMGSNAPK